ncbi:MAG: nuclear transport factor 2 family protein, partial [Chloroflexota bacterium]|nr:nuclear transport factor 2 family protein [Chloroflexota bacterium]
MKRLAIAMMALGLAMMLALPLRASAQGSSPLAVVDAYMAALSAKDVDAALALVDDNIVQTYNPFPPPGLSRVNRGKETFRGLLQGFT